MEAKICPDGTAVGRTGPNCEFAACPNGDAMFSEEGTIQNNSSTMVVFQYQNGGTTYTKNLAFDGESICGGKDGVIACLALNVGIGTAYADKDVRVTGIDRGADLLVRRLETVSKVPGPTRATVTAHVGQTISAVGISITPTAVVDDSRCPANVQCIWAGTVHVSAKLSSGMGDSNVTFELGQSITTETEFVTLTAVSPAKNSGTEISQSQYLLTFEVQKR